MKAALQRRIGQVQIQLASSSQSIIFRLASLFQVSHWARVFAEYPSGSERLEQAGRCSTPSWQASRRGNGTRQGGSGGIPWPALVPPIGARLALFIQRPQTPRNPNQAGAGGARKPAALDCFPLSFAPLPASPDTSQHPNRRGPMAPHWGISRLRR